MPDATPRHSRDLSISRSLLAIAAIVLAAITGATVFQLVTLRGAIVNDTAQQMSRLDMVFAEQTGRAVEMADFIVRDTLETLQVDGSVSSALLARRIQGVRLLTALTITDAFGRIIPSTPPRPAAARSVLHGLRARTDNAR